MNLTSLLDLLGIVLVIIGLAALVALWSMPGAVITAGGACLLASWLIDRGRKT
ncbi:hypothetical protein [Arthrobacter alpinus]|uniref:hypothetical protein n=1 Tax=Arthrobacter alpinus TaxID=656366 RepID=UPI000AFF55DC|nr:hypothetical protein [Arthrobacter alpinus]